MRTMNTTIIIVVSILEIGCSATPAVTDQSVDHSGSEPPTDQDTSTGTGSGAPAPLTPCSVGAYQSGSRIRCRFLAGADGTRQFISWYDSQRHEDCSIGCAVDEVYRCLPVALGGGIVVGYSDAECTSVVVDPVGSTYFKMDFVSTLCGAAADLFEYGPPSPAYEYDPVAMKCKVAAVQPPVSLLIGPEIPPGSFVHFSDVID